MMAMGMAGSLSAITAGTGSAATFARTHATARPAVSRSAITLTPAYTPKVWLMLQDAYFHFSTGGEQWIWAGDKVKISCYYSGATGLLSDPYWDHVTWSSYYAYAAGHVADAYVDLGDKYPWQVGIPHC
jgi:hypothetical protein